MKVYKLTEIDYDAPKKVCKKLPYTILMSQEHLASIEEDLKTFEYEMTLEEYLLEEGANIISDTTYWCVNSWKLVIEETDD